MTELSKDIVEISNQISDHLDKMNEFEGTLRNAFLQKKNDKINTYMNTKQANVMKLKQLEEKRLKIFEQHGLLNTTAKQLLQTLDNQDKKDVSVAIDRLTESYKKLSYSNKVSLDIANNLSLLLEKGKADNKNLYGLDGKKTSGSSGSPTFFEKV